MRHADSIFPLSGGGARAQAGFHPVAASLLICPLESSLIAFVKLVTGVCPHAGFMVLSAVGLDGPPHVGVRCSDRPKWSSWLPMAPHFQGRPDPRQTSRRGRIC
jgi:hypothetical protein